MKTVKLSQLFMLLAKQVLNNQNHCHTQSLINHVSKEYTLDDKVIAKTILHLIRKEYFTVHLEKSDYKKTGVQLTHYISLSKIGCDAVRAIKAREEHHDEQNNGDKDIPSDEYYTPEFDETLKEAHEQQPTMLDLLK